LLLRAPMLADARPLMDIFWDPEVVERKQVTLRQAPGGLDLAVKNTGDMLRQWELRGYGQWCVVEIATGDVIGCVGFYHPQEPWPGSISGGFFTVRDGAAVSRLKLRLPRFGGLGRTLRSIASSA
jgi:hypothetical protein